MQTSRVFIDLVQGFALKHNHYSQFSNFAGARFGSKKKTLKLPEPTGKRASCECKDASKVACNITEKAVGNVELIADSHTDVSCQQKNLL